MHSLYTDRSFPHTGVPVIGYSKIQDLWLLCWLLDPFLLESRLLQATPGTQSYRLLSYWSHSDLSNWTGEANRPSPKLREQK